MDPVLLGQSRQKLLQAAATYADGLIAQLHQAHPTLTEAELRHRLNDHYDQILEERLAAKLLEAGCNKWPHLSIEQVIDQISKGALSFDKLLLEKLTHSFPVHPGTRTGKGKLTPDSTPSYFSSPVDVPDGTAFLLDMIEAGEAIGEALGAIAEAILDWLS
jgi:hypothetical protein